MPGGRILLVEDDDATRTAVCALLEDAGFVCEGVVSGEQALARVREDSFDLVLLDLVLPGISGADVQRELRRDSRTRFLPILFLTAQTDREAKVAQLSAGADDYLTKPYDADELIARVGAALRRASGLRALNPLSGLPGNTTITEEIDTRLEQQSAFALLYVDIDRFKEFNDHYGFARGDRLIARVAEMLASTTCGNDGRCFLGHIGGDDFIVLAPSSDGEGIAKRITRTFDALVPDLYDNTDRERGYLEVQTRRGGVEQIPFATVSIGIVNVTPGRFTGAVAAARAAAEVKEVAKRQTGSTWAIDRRRH